MSVWTPANFGARHKLWVDADLEAAGALATFTDRSGNANHFIQATGARQPVNTASVLNGRKGLLFTRASNHWMQCASLTGIPDINVTVFAVWTHGNNAANDETLLSFWNAAFPDQMIVAWWGSDSPGKLNVNEPGDLSTRADYTTSATDAHGTIFQFAQLRREIWFDGVSVANQTTDGGTSPTITKIDLGGRFAGGGDALGGYVHQINIITGTPTADDVGRWSAYVAQRWGVTNTGLYTNGPSPLPFRRRASWR